MIQGLAIWHYPHRTPLENVRYFIGAGLGSVSLSGWHFADICKDPEQSRLLNDLLAPKDTVLTVHAKLPADFSDEAREAWKRDADLAADWQKKYGRLANYTFDVPDAIRSDIRPYLDYMLKNIPGTKIGVEDFGLTQEEFVQLRGLENEPRFGYLLDAGHLHIRLNGHTVQPEYRLFHPSALECPKDPASVPTEDDYLWAIAHKPFPIIEIHLHNNDGADDVHWFMEDERGTLDMRMMARVLKKVNYAGVLTVESAPGFRFACAGKDADDGIAKTLAFWQDCLDKA